MSRKSFSSAIAAIVSIFVTVIAVLLVYNAYTTAQSHPSHTASTPTTIHTNQETVTPQSPAAKKEKNGDDMMPGLVDVVRHTDKPRYTIPASKEVTYVLPDKGGSTIGNEGLDPSTPVYILSERNVNGRNKYNLCTVAFSVSGKNGSPYAITAGHCGEVGQPVYRVTKEKTLNQSTEIGVVDYVSHSDYDTGAGDWAAIKLNPGALRPFAEGDVPRRLGVTNVQKGDLVCKHGARTGYDCGPQQDKQLEAIIGDKTAKLDEVTLCALEGDSGGPIYTQKYIIGVLSSSSASAEDMQKGVCSTDSQAYYTPMRDVVEQVKKNVPDALFEHK